MAGTWFDKERARIIGNAERTLREIASIFADCESWNDNHPECEPLNADPDGTLRLLIERLEAFIASAVLTEGLLPPFLSADERAWLERAF